MREWLLYLALTCVTAVATGAPAPRAFHVENLGETVPLSSQEHPDELKIAVDGDSCADATVSFVIRSAAEREIYRFEAPYAGWKPDCSPDKAADAARAFIAKRDLYGFRFASLPRWTSAAEAAERGIEFLVPEATYRRLRMESNTWVLRPFEHESAPGEVRWLLFDGKEGHATALFRKSESLAKANEARAEKRRSTPPYAFRDEARIAFTSRGEVDRMEVAVISQSAGSARLRVRVTDSREREVYLYEDELPSTDFSVEDYVENTLDSAGLERSDSLEPYDEPGAYSPQVPKETYERLRAANLPMIQVQDSSESWLEVVYDEEIGKGVVVRIPSGD
jgi:hypothetical protein